MDKVASAPAQAFDAPLQLGLSRILSKPPSASETAALTARPPQATTQAVSAPVVAPDANVGEELSMAPVLLALLAFAALGTTIALKIRRQKQSGHESVIWAQAQGVPSSISPPPAKRAMSPAADQAQDKSASAPRPLGKPNATVYDLQLLATQLRTLLRGRNDAGCWTLLTNHLSRCERSSPWVYLELYQVAKRLGKEQDWKVFRLNFRQQFGQAAPAWGTNLPYTDLMDDALLSAELTKLWPSSSTRSWIERWMLGTGLEVGKGPPLLTITIYRDMLWLDKFLADLLRTASAKHRERLGGV